MADTDPALEGIRRAAEELLPDLTERLGRYGLGELEVRRGDLRLRVTQRVGASGPAVASPQSAAGGVSRRTVPGGGPTQGGTPAVQATDGPAASGTAPGGSVAPVPVMVGVSSPAVGTFAYATGLGPGLVVKRGEALGWVEMLGVRHDVRAPRGGTVRNLVTESGEAVEYGQLLIELEAGAR